MTTELDNLAGAAAQADAATLTIPGTDAPAPVDQPKPEPSLEEQAEDMVGMFAGLVINYAPAAADVWTEPARKACAEVIAPLAEKYGWSMKKIPPELAAAIVVGPLLYKSAEIVADKIKADRAAKAAPHVAAPASSQPAPPPVGEPGAAPPAAIHPQMALYA